MPTNIFKEHEELCRREARVIVHDPDLWAQYLLEAENTYSGRAKQFSDTGRAVVEYAPNFEQKFGADLKDNPATIDGAVVREDIFIVHHGKPVAQFVNFYARRDFAGRTPGINGTRRFNH